MKALKYGAIALVFIIVSAMSVAVVQSRSDAATNCTNVHFIGAAGSGGDYRLMKDTQANLEKSIKSAGRTFSAEQLAYTAEKIPVLGGDFTVTIDSFVRSIEDGYKKAKTVALDYLSNCQDSNLVLAGYSQGAMVMHRMLQLAEFSNKADDKKFLSKVAGVFLLADGDRLAFEGGARNLLLQDGIKNRGGASLIGQGVAQALPSIFKASDRQLSRPLASKTLSWCKFADPVCDISPGVVGGLVGAGIYTGRTNSNALKFFYSISIKPIMNIHSSYNAKDWNTELSNVVKANAKWPTPPTTTTTKPPTTTTTTPPVTTPPPPTDSCVHPPNGDLGLVMPPAKIGEYYDQVWRIPAWEGCLGGYYRAFVLSPLDYLDMRTEPVTESSGRSEAVRVYGTPSRENALALARELGLTESAVRSGPVTMHAFNERDGELDEFDATVCWGVLDDDGTYPCNK